MATKALDLVTMAHALDEMSRVYLGDSVWVAVNEYQSRFMRWYEKNIDYINGLARDFGGLSALASTDYSNLNAFLREHGFNSQFGPFDGVGAASVLDLLVEWLHKGSLTTLERYDSESRSFIDYPAFKIGGGGADVFKLSAYSNPLVRLKTVSGHSLWFMKTETSFEHPLDLALEAEAMLRAEGVVDHRYDGVVVPMLDIDVSSDLGWMVGMHTNSEKDGYHRIVQAFQGFKLRANAQGARVKVATGFATTRGMSFEPEPYKLDEPFVGLFTAPGYDAIPIAAFWADVDSWKNPGGSLDF